MFIGRTLSVVLAIAACAIQTASASEASPSLTGSTFSNEIARGTTFVKFYSPQCGHCIALAPTWEQLAVNHKDWATTKDFKFAEVNCLVEGEICDDNNVGGYPTLALFRDGKPVHSYKGGRSIDELTEFVTSRAAVEYDVNPSGKVIVLDSTNFESKIKSDQPWLIEYYAPWCGHCKALAPIYDDLAKELKGKVNIGKVDCPANEVICRSQGVRGYPTIKLHLNGHATEFKGKRIIENFVSFVSDATTPSVKPIFISDIPGIKAQPEASIIFLHDDSISRDIKSNVDSLSMAMFGKVPIYSSPDPSLAREFGITSLPALLLLKDERQYQYLGSLSDGQAMKTWAEQNKNPLVPLVTNSNSASILNAPGWVVLGLFDPSKPSSAAGRHALIETAHAYQQGLASGRLGLVYGRPVRFATLDATKWTNYIKNSLKVELLNLPVVVAVNSEKDIFYPVGADGRRVPIEQEALLQYITDIASGNLQEQSMLSYAQRTFRSISDKATSVFGFIGQHPYLSVAAGVGLFYAFVRKLSDDRPEHHAESLAKAD